MWRRRAAPVAGARGSIFRNRSFLVLWSGQTVSIMGSQVSYLALPLLVLGLTGSTVHAGGITAARLVPYAIFSLPAGALIDRWNRKAVMIVADAVRAVALGSIPVTYALGHLTLWLLYGAVLVEGTAFVFFTIAQVASLTGIVTPDELPQANAMNEASGSLATFLGPGLGGWIISLGRTTIVGAVLALVVDSASYLASVISLASLKMRLHTARVASALSLRRQIEDGIRFLVGNPYLRILAVLGLNLGLFVIPGDLVLIVLARQQLHLGAQVIGLFFSAGGLGALVGSAIAPWFKARLRLSRVVYGTTLGLALSAGAMAVTSSAVVLAAAMVLKVMMLPIYNVSQISYRLLLIPDELQGRVNSVFRLIPLASQPVGLGAAGILVNAVGPRAVFGLIAAGFVTSALFVRLTSLHEK